MIGSNSRVENRAILTDFEWILITIERAYSQSLALDSGVLRRANLTAR